LRQALRNIPVMWSILCVCPQVFLCVPSSADKWLNVTWHYICKWLRQNMMLEKSKNDVPSRWARIWWYAVQVYWHRQQALLALAHTRISILCRCI
jgi:hypothetical protein